MHLSFLAVRRTLIPITAALAVALSGCGGSSDASTGNSSAGDDSDAGRVKLQQCLRDNGVDVPDNPGSGGGRPANLDREKIQEAMNGPCKEFQSGGFGNLSDADRQEMQDAFQRFAQCMRDQGIDVPSGTPGGGPAAGGGGINQDDPKVQAASEQCQDKLPQNLPGRGGQ